MENKNPIMMLCHHCKHKWEYNGVQKFYASCPRCRYKVNINKNKRRNLDQGNFDDIKNNQKQPK